MADGETRMLDSSCVKLPLSPCALILGDVEASYATVCKVSDDGRLILISFFQGEVAGFRPKGRDSGGPRLCSVE